MRKVILIIITLIVLAVPNIFIAGKERILSKGRTVLVDLGRRDPRSLMQGDYMRLWYTLPEAVAGDIREARRDGKVVVTLDERGVATVLRLNSAHTPLEKGEFLLAYRFRGEQVYLGARSFFFQEGDADLYSGARFGEIKVARNGESVLVGLRGADLEKLGVKD